MQAFNYMEKLAAEHSRLHSVEQWPDGPRKQAALDAIRSALAGLARLPATSEGNFACILCQNRRMNLTVLEPRGSTPDRAVLDSPAGWKRAS